MNRVGGAAVLAVFGLSMMVSFSSLIFRGDLAPSLGRGVGLTLTGAAVIGVIVAWRSSIPGHVAGPQDATAVVLGVVAAEMVSDGATVDTVVAYLVLATLAAGVLLFGLVDDRNCS